MCDERPGQLGGHTEVTISEISAQLRSPQKKKKSPEPTFTVQTSDVTACGVLSYKGFHANSGLLEQCKAKKKWVLKLNVIETSNPQSCCCMHKQLQGKNTPLRQQKKKKKITKSPVNV